MEAAKSAINKFTSQRGHHTSVEESVNPAVTRETIKPVRHEEATQAVDREVHQHHYHTTVQPLTHQEKLPEKHTHNLLPTEHREFHHDNEHETKQRLASELGHFKDTQRVEQVRETQAAAPTVTGEHVHHHVHETVVPVVHKETIQPEVVHTTVPVHETHHAAAQHHGLSALPMKTLDEFKTSGGVLTGGNHGSREEYEGPPRKYNEKLSTTLEKLGLEGHGHHHQQTDSGVSGVGDNYNNRDGIGGRNTDRTTGTTGTTGTNNYGSNREGLGNTTGTNNYGSNREGLGNTTGTNKYDNQTTSGTGAGGATGTGKPSLKDRLNPKVDADGDGKAGIMN